MKERKVNQRQEEVRVLLKLLVGGGQHTDEAEAAEKVKIKIVI